MTDKQPAWMKSLWEGILRLVKRTLDALYHPPQDRYSWLINIGVIAGLFSGGSPCGVVFLVGGTFLLIFWIGLR